MIEKEVVIQRNQLLQLLIRAQQVQVRVEWLWLLPPLKRLQDISDHLRLAKPVEKVWLKGRNLRRLVEAIPQHRRLR